MVVFINIRKRFLNEWSDVGFIEILKLLSLSREKDSHYLGNDRPRNKFPDFRVFRLLLFAR